MKQADYIQILAHIEIAKIGARIDLKKFGHSYLQYVKFESWEHSTDRDRKEKPYSWVAQTNSMYSHRTVFPTKSINYVKFFKTLKGAKRNFLKSYIHTQNK